MGTLITTSIMIKLLLTSSLLALTAAEADPQVLAYSGLPYAAALPAAVPALHPVGAVAHAPVVKSDVITPAEVSHEVAAAPIVTYAHHFGYYGKRSADAEPEADADAYYGHYGYGYGYGHYRGYNRGYYGHPYAYYGKRSADAEPAVLGGASRVLTAPTPLIHNPPALPAVTYAHPLGYAVPYAGLHYASLPVVAPAAPAAAEAVVAERKKREADPQVLLGGLPYAAPLAAHATFATVGAVPHAPVVKNVEVTPAEVSHEVTAHPVPVAVGYHGLPS